MIINYIAFGIFIMLIIEYGSPYPWKIFERILIVIFWPIATIIMLHALYKRLFEDE